MRLNTERIKSGMANLFRTDNQAHLNRLRGIGKKQRSRGLFVGILAERRQSVQYQIQAFLLRETAEPQGSLLSPCLRIARNARNVRHSLVVSARTLHRDKARSGRSILLKMAIALTSMCRKLS